MKEYLHPVLVLCVSAASSGIWLVDIKTYPRRAPINPDTALILTSCVLNVILMQFDLVFNCSNLINGSVNKKAELWPPTLTDMHSKQLQAPGRFEFLCLKAEFNPKGV